MHYSRPLIPCIAAYITGMFLVHEVYETSPALAVCIGTLFVFILILIASRYKNMTAVFLALIMVFGAAVMGVRDKNRRHALELVRQMDGPTVKIISGKVAAIADIADLEKFRVVLSDVTVTSGSQKFVLPGKVQVTFQPDQIAETEEALVVGEHITFPGRIREPSALRNFFGYDRLEALRHESIYASASPLPVKAIVKSVPGSRNRIFPSMTRSLMKLRKEIVKNLHRDMWHREGRLMTAMLFNDMRSLNDDEREIFRNSGTFHLFAVSGMHVAVIGMALHLLLRTLRFGIRSSWVTVAVILFMYLWIIGFVPSATRSYLMLLAFTMAYILGREVDGLTSLTFAFGTTIFYDPSSLWQAGFILSVLGVASIILFVPLWRHWLEGNRSESKNGISGWLLNNVIDIALTTAAIAMILLPLQLYYFGFWNILSPLANILQAFISMFVLGAGLAVTFCGMLSETIAKPLGTSASVLMWLTYKISEWTAEIQWAIIYVKAIPAWLMLISYTIIFSGYYLVQRSSPEFRLKSRARFVTHTCCGLGLLFLFQLDLTPKSNYLEIYCFDVDQGDSTLLRLPGGETVLIDGGMARPDMGELVIIQQLRSLGINHLDFLVATHDDIDHTGGLPAVLEKIPVGKILVPVGMKYETEASRKILRLAQAKDCEILEVQTGFKSQSHGCSLEILNPAPGNDPNLPDNDRSIVLKLDYRDFTGLFMGDAGLSIEGRLLNECLKNPVSVLKIGHHGSNSATGAEFVSSLHPACALISCGKGNKFGHPHPKVVSRLLAENTEILRTDTQGALHLTTDGATIWAKTRIP